MAEKRMISKSISLSERVNQLPEIFDMLLYTWLIPHTDDFGRLTGSPVKVKYLVVPMLDSRTVSDVERSLVTLHNAGLIIWYQVGSDKYIQVAQFEKHQTGLHKRTQSKFPEPPQHSGKFPEIPPQGKGTEGNRTEQNGTEEKGTEGSLPAPLSDLESIKTNLHNLINECKIQQYNLFDLDELYSFIGVVDVEVIEAAIRKGSGKQSIKYSINTLKGMIKDGKTKKEHIFEKPEPGQASEHRQQPNRGYSRKPHLEVVQPRSQGEVTDEELLETWLLAREVEDKPAPSEQEKAEYLARMRMGEARKQAAAAAQ